MVNKKNRFKQGAASFYMVAIATLVLVVIATSFAAIIIAEINRTSNNDLAQSAYDAAMAGVEDARLAYYNYENCVKDNTGADRCAEQYLGNADDCNSFVESLGRDNNGGAGVKVQEGSENDMEQVYTCVKISKKNDYARDLNDDNPTVVVKVKLADGIDASSIKAIRMSWGYKTSEDMSMDTLPPMLEVGLLQASNSFTMDDFAMMKGDETNRGTVFLQPVSDGGATEIDQNGFLKSNDKTVLNGPYEVHCNGDMEPQCSVTIDLPDPVGGERSNDNFVVMWSLMGGAGGNNVSVVMELLCNDGGCGSVDGGGGSSSVADLDMQVGVDSTGRANDLYRRVSVRLEPEDTALQENGKKIYALMAKEILKSYATCEQNFIDSPNCSN